MCFQSARDQHNKRRTQEAHRELRKEVSPSLFSKLQTCAENEVARQPLTSIGFGARCSCSLAERTIRMKAQDREK